MQHYQNKKSAVGTFVIRILLLSAAFLIILFILDIFRASADEKATDAICRGSVALREKSHFEVREPITPAELKIGEAATPLLCKTFDKYIPKDKDATKEQVKKEIADLMASCWKRYGEGFIPDVFKEGDPVTKNCQICYTVSLRETSKFKGEIKSADFLQYLFDTPYKVDSKDNNCKINGGYCIDTDNVNDCGGKINADRSYLQIDKKSDVCKKKDQKSCCYTDYECWNRGGKCSSINPDEENYRIYSRWECPPKMKCYVKKEDFYPYGEYIQRFGGPGNILVLTDIKLGDTYAVSFGSPTGHCGWCTYLGLGTGAGTVALALWAGVPTGGIGTVGVLTVSALFAGGYTLGKGGSEIAVDKLFERDINTVYLTTLTQIQEGDHCRIVREIGE